MARSVLYLDERYAKAKSVPAVEDIKKVTQVRLTEPWEGRTTLILESGDEVRCIDMAVFRKLEI